MQKNSKTQSSDSKKEKPPKILTEKIKNPFDHIAHIREIKDPNYYKSLSDADKKSFNRYIITMGLSMDSDIIQDLAYVSKYFDVMPDEAYYKACCNIVPLGRRYVKWIKANKPKYNIKLIETIAKYFQIGKRDAYGYCDQFIKTEEGITEMIKICSLSGYSGEEIEEFFETKEEKK
jgi:hypothetical protein